MNVIRFRCPNDRRTCRRATSVAVYTTAPEHVENAIHRAACRHITTTEREQLAAGQVPERLTVRGERPTTRTAQES